MDLWPSVCCRTYRALQNSWDPVVILICPRVCGAGVALCGASCKLTFAGLSDSNTISAALNGHY